jgi:hypothetical protein
VIDLAPLSDQQVRSRQERYRLAYEAARDRWYYFMQNHEPKRAEFADMQRQRYQDECERCSADLGRRHRMRAGRVSFVVTAW